MEQTNKTTNKWNFLPVHKTRIIKDTEKYQLIRVDALTSTILPKCFKRAKENEECVFYSLPQDFQINMRTSVHDEFDNSWSYTDKLYALEKIIGELKLNTPIE